MQSWGGRCAAGAWPPRLRWATERGRRGCPRLLGGPEGANRGPCPGIDQGHRVPSSLPLLRTAPCGVKPLTRHSGRASVQVPSQLRDSTGTAPSCAPAADCGSVSFCVHGFLCSFPSVPVFPQMKRNPKPNRFPVPEEQGPPSPGLRGSPSHVFPPPIIFLPLGTHVLPPPQFMICPSMWHPHPLPAPSGPDPAPGRVQAEATSLSCPVLTSSQHAIPSHLSVWDSGRWPTSDSPAHMAMVAGPTEVGDTGQRDDHTSGSQPPQAKY